MLVTDQVQTDNNELAFSISMLDTSQVGGLVSAPVSGKLKDVLMKLLGMSEAQKMYASVQRDQLRLRSIGEQLDLFRSIGYTEDYIVGALLVLSACRFILYIDIHTCNHNTGHRI